MSPEYAEIVAVLAKHWESTFFSVVIGFGSLVCSIWVAVHFLFKNQLADKDSTIRRLDGENTSLRKNQKEDSALFEELKVYSDAELAELKNTVHALQAGLTNQGQEIKLLKENRGDINKVDSANTVALSTSVEVESKIDEFKNNKIYQAILHRMSLPPSERSRTLLTEGLFADEPPKEDEDLDIDGSILSRGEEEE